MRSDDEKPVNSMYWYRSSWWISSSFVPSTSQPASTRSFALSSSVHFDPAVQDYRLQSDEPKVRTRAGRDTTEHQIRGIYMSLETWVRLKMCIHWGKDAEGNSPVQEVKWSVYNHEVGLRQAAVVILTVGETCVEVFGEHGFEVVWRE